MGRIHGDNVELAFGYWPGRGAPIVALHGLTASHMNFIGVADRLAGRFPIFAPDLRGRGNSDKPCSGYGMAQHARDVAACMRALALGPSVIVGHSMGAFVAAALADQSPELVCGLVLIDGGFVPAMARAESPQGLDAALRLRIEQLRSTYSSREAYLQFWRGQPHFPAAEWNPWIEAFLEYELGGEPPDLKPKACEAGVIADLQEGLHGEEIIRRLHSIRVPVLVLRAEHGFVPGAPPLYPDTMLEQFRTHLPQLEDHFFAGTTHYTIVLGTNGAAQIADLLDKFAVRCHASPRGFPHSSYVS
jgi:pimeloyl-ACP methyl ester carboxylesterase